MKQNLKKVYMFFCVFIIGIFLVIPTVYAKNKQWPSISEDNISKIIADSPDYSLCVYNVGSGLNLIILVQANFIVINIMLLLIILKLMI